jgi:hypothetical protein
MTDWVYDFWKRKWVLQLTTGDPILGEMMTNAIHKLAAEKKRNKKDEELEI